MCSAGLTWKKRVRLVAGEPAKDTIPHGCAHVRPGGSIERVTVGRRGSLAFRTGLLELLARGTDLKPSGQDERIAGDYVLEQARVDELLGNDVERIGEEALEVCLGGSGGVKPPLCGSPAPTPRPEHGGPRPSNPPWQKAPGLEGWGSIPGWLRAQLFPSISRPGREKVSGVRPETIDRARSSAVACDEPAEKRLDSLGFSMTRHRSK